MAHPFERMLLHEAQRLALRAEECRAIAGTDPARYKPAMESARALDERAAHIRKCVAEYDPFPPYAGSKPEGPR